MVDKLIQCKCGHILVNGNGAVFFGKGTSIKCKKCGNTYIFKEDETIGSRHSQNNEKNQGIRFKV